MERGVEMHGYQFFRVEAYGRKGSACGRPSRKRGVRAEKTGGKWSLSQILDEAERVDGACPHVENPKAPVILPGFPMKPREFLQYAEEQAEGGKDAWGRKLRVDAVIAVAGVASFPLPAWEIAFEEEARAAYDLWEETLLKFLKLEYGDMVRCALRHTDEGHWHVHFYVVEDRQPDGSFGVREIHPGRRAKEAARQKGGTIRDMDDAYDAAMEKLQDRYWEKVSKLCEQERMGPMLYRSDRWSWKQKKLKSIWARKLEEEMTASNKKLKMELLMAETNAKASMDFAIHQMQKDHERQTANLMRVIEEYKVRDEQRDINEKRLVAALIQERKDSVGKDLLIARLRADRGEEGGMSM